MAEWRPASVSGPRAPRPPETLGGAPMDAGPPGMTGGEILKGVLITGLLHLIQIPFAFTGAFLAIGVTQLVYVGPALVVAYAKGRHGIATGILIAAGLTLLINAACFFLVLQAFSTG